MTKNRKIPQIKTVPKKFWHNQDWYVKRFNWYPLIFSTQIISIFYHPHVKTPFSYKWAGTFCNESADWRWDLNDQIRVRDEILKKASKSKKYTDWFLSEFLKYVKDQEKIFNEFEEVDFAKLSNTELSAALDDLFWSESGVAAWGYLADSFLTTGEDNWLLEEIKKETANTVTIEILTAPGFQSFINKEKISLLKIGMLNKNKPKYEKVLMKHRDSFYWILNDYWLSHNFGVKFFEDLVKKLKKENINLKKVHKEESLRVKRNLKAKQGAYQKHRLSKKLQNIIYCSDNIGYIQDTRKQAALRLSHFLFLIADEIAKRAKITKIETLNLTYPEVHDALLNKEVNRKELKARIKKCFIYFSPQGYKIFSGKRAIVINKKIFQTKEKQTNVLKGTPVFIGLVSGRVRVVNSHRDMKLFKSGEILVTNNTTPEFVPLMKKARAIVTEQGGMTTHAAIVSRELKVPCIVGVTDVTKIFKTGDKVEVDANKGIVRKLKS